VDLEVIGRQEPDRRSFDIEGTTFDRTFSQFYQVILELRTKFHCCECLNFL